jgi:flagellar biosynthesis protein FlhA
MEVEVGAALVRLVDPAGGGGLLDRIADVRRRLAAELGLVVPPVRILDNLQLLSGGYVIRLNGAAVGSGSLRADRLLAVDTGSVSGTIEGERTTDPAFGAPAAWIAESDRERAKGLGWAVAEPAQALAAHVEELVKRHAHELLTRDEVQNLIRTLKERRPAVVEEVVPAVLKPGEVQKVLQNLLREGVSIRDLGTILEALGDGASRTHDPEVLTEVARNALARAICRPYLDRDGRLFVITLDPKLEDLVRGALERTERGTQLALTPATASAIADRVAKAADALAAAGHPPVLLCTSTVRPALKRLLDAVRPGVAVLSYHEIVPEAKVESTGRVALEGAL